VIGVVEYINIIPGNFVQQVKRESCISSFNLVYDVKNQIWLLVGSRQRSEVMHGK
jgi:hypothetical protein